jgi:hypothetical protein
MEIAGDAIYIPLYHSNSRSSTEPMASQDFSDRPSKKLVLFDVDGTLTPARQVNLIPLTAFTVTHALIWRKGSVT